MQGSIEERFNFNNTGINLKETDMYEHMKW